MSDGITDAYRQMSRNRIMKEAEIDMKDEYELLFKAVDKIDKLYDEIYELKTNMRFIKEKIILKHIQNNDLQNTNT